VVQASVGDNEASKNIPKDKTVTIRRENAKKKKKSVDLCIPILRDSTLAFVVTRPLPGILSYDGMAQRKNWVVTRQLLYTNKGSSCFKHWALSISNIEKVD
jgi:hypothetical protein